MYSRNVWESTRLAPYCLKWFGSDWSSGLFLYLGCSWKYWKVQISLCWITSILFHAKLCQEVCSEVTVISLPAFCKEAVLSSRRLVENILHTAGPFPFPRVTTLVLTLGLFWFPRHTFSLLGMWACRVFVSSIHLRYQSQAREIFDPFQICMTCLQLVIISVPFPEVLPVQIHFSWCDEN